MYKRNVLHLHNDSKKLYWSKENFLNFYSKHEKIRKEYQSDDIFSSSLLSARGMKRVRVEHIFAAILFLETVIIEKSINDSVEESLKNLKDIWINFLVMEQK